MERGKTHEFRLNKEPFESMKNGDKKIEMRLFDAKRQLLKKGDRIIFVKKDDEIQILKTRIIGLHRFKNFEELYSHFDKKVLGYKEDEIARAEDMSKYYSKEDIEKFGVVGIEIEVE